QGIAMLTALACLALAVLTGVAATTTKELEGTWVIVSVTLAGKSGDWGKDGTYVFDEDTLIISGRNVSSQKGTVTSDPNPLPRHLDFTLTGGRTIKMVYSPEKDELRIGQPWGIPLEQRPAAVSSKEKERTML